MPDINLAVQVATIVSAITSSIQLGVSYLQAEKKVDKKEMERQAKILVSTYDDNELASLHDRIKTCRDRFVNEGSGTQRVKCMCSVLKDAITGNGDIPPLPEWGRMYNQLCS
ncbi:hypothetical protein ACJJIU_10150 [Microbulbifer sp. CnH-101-E]|uniref:hypothetical protein n=1 Tax=unclassified Microbulbifer TaxID=2619833 RepID=UPI00403A0005